jgi:hypothetical protein
VVSASERSTGKTYNAGKRCAKQEKKNSKNDKRPPECGRWRLLGWVSRRTMRKRDKDKSHCGVKQWEKEQSAATPATT